MDMNAEATRIMTLSLRKLYSSRAQRGGLRLHRSLLLSLVMRTARDMYQAAQLLRESEAEIAAARSANEQLATEEQMDTSSGQVETSAPQCPKAVPQLDSEPSEGESEPGCATPVRDNEDKENCSPASRSDRYSRKRRGKAAAEPDFLPSKKARMDGADVNPVSRSAGLRNCKGNVCRAGESFTSVPLCARVVAAC